MFRLRANAFARAGSFCTKPRARSFCTKPIAVRPLHLLLYTYVEDVVEVRKTHRSAHVAAARAASARGDLLLGGALADPVDGAVMAFTASEAAEEFAATDPYVLNGLVTSWTVRECALLPLFRPFVCR